MRRRSTDDGLRFAPLLLLPYVRSFYGGIRIFGGPLNFGFLVFAVYSQKMNGIGNPYIASGRRVTRDKTIFLLTIT